MRNKLILISVTAIAAIAAATLFMRPDAEAPTPAAQEEAHGEHGHGHDHDEHGHGKEGREEEGHVAVTPEIAAQSGITLEEVGPAKVRETVELTGRILLNQNATASVKARYPGIVRDVKKSVGEIVAKGDVLALVESNDSLQVYPVTAPLGGTVLERTVNAGDTTGDAPIFVISDLSQLWAEFHVFPQDSKHVQMGQSVDVSSVQENIRGQAQIIAMLPMAESATQTLVVRALLPNEQRQWRPSMIAHGDVATSEHDVLLAVRTEAIQRMGDDSVIFVQEGNGFEMRKLKLGATDSQWSEVLDGADLGDRYAVKNSFLLKAELGKSEAGHSHDH
jgi:membrane fusion protein, heavy metal efflux system